MSGFRTIEVSDPALTPEGVHFITVKSAALQRRSDVSFYVPPNVEGEREMPLVILLHGVYGSHWAWLFKGGAHRVLQRLMAEENLPPMALAMPSDGLWGDGTGYLAHEEADYTRWIVDEVPAAAALVAPGIVGAPRFIAGLSMGGYGALRLGTLHPEAFSAISAHSSITDFLQMQGFVEETLPMFRLTESEPTSVIGCMRAHAGRLPPLRFDCGTEDELIEYNRTLHRELKAAGIPHSYEEFPGGHSWDYWHQHLADTLRFFARYC